MRVPPAGPIPATYVIVGEAPGSDEVRAMQPFVGSSGQELNRILHDAGILRADCFVTNVCKHRPPGNDIDVFISDAKTTAATLKLTHFKDGQYFNDLVAAGLKELAHEIEIVKPTVILALGDTALWALTGLGGITNWRGSVLPCSLVPGVKVIPTYHPALVLRQWEWRPTVVHDLKRAARESAFPEIRLPNYSFVVRPSAGAVLETLADLHARCDAGPTMLSVDIETRAQQIACIGLAWTTLDAICIPLLCVESPEGYWSPEDELAITVALRRLLTHPNCHVIGQNFLYDAQYFAKQYGYVPNVIADTMLMQHVAFPGTPKSLDYLSSMYCFFHQYWKGEGKLWNPKTTPEEQLWTYNCKDAVITYEVYNTLVDVLHKCGLWEVFQRQMGLFTPVLHMMLRGVRIDTGYRKELATTLLGEIAEREESINNIAGFPLNPRSPKQMKAFFYDDLRLPIQFNRKTRKPSLDDEALDKLTKKEVLVRPLIKLIREIRSLGVFNSTFVGAALDTDGRIRCSFNISGTETFRFSSSENAFGSGTNLQNIPKGKEDDASLSSDDLRLPNVRKLFIPDSGFTIADCDQSGADAQVVAWEANDDILKQLFRAGVKIHAHNAKDLYGADAGADGKQEPYYSRTKQGVHLSNYGGTARTLAVTIGITIHEAEKFQRRWFDIHPGIKDWHRRIESDLQTRRFVANRFGYRRFYFGRIEELLPEALAWIPQSTVAIITNTALERIHRELPSAELLLQVHDSLVFQYRTAIEERTLSSVRPLLAVVVPYDDPLVIPWGLKTSTKSWGACEDRKWPGV